jgi:outer membrane protein assembly factor BamB
LRPDQSCDDRFVIPARITYPMTFTSRIPELVAQAARERRSGIQVLFLNNGFHYQSLVAIDAAHFTPIWQRTVPSRWRGCRPVRSVIQGQGLVFVADWTGVQAIDAATGRLVWFHGCTRNGHELTLGNDLAIVGDTLERSTENYYERLSIRTGAILPW